MTQCHPERNEVKSKDPEEVTLKVTPRDPSTYARDDGGRLATAAGMTEEYYGSES